jgi:hypothetical protein
MPGKTRSSLLSIRTVLKTIIRQFGHAHLEWCDPPVVPLPHFPKEHCFPGRQKRYPTVALCRLSDATDIVSSLIATTQYGRSQLLAVLENTPTAIRWLTNLALVHRRRRLSCSFSFDQGCVF